MSVKAIPILVAVVVLTSGLAAGVHAQAPAPAPEQVSDNPTIEEGEGVADHEYGCELLADRMLAVTGDNTQENPDLECEGHNEANTSNEYEASPPQTIEAPRIGPSFVTNPDIVPEEAEELKMKQKLMKLKFKLKLKRMKQQT